MPLRKLLRVVVPLLLGVTALNAQDPTRLRREIEQSNGRVIITLKNARPDSTPSIRMRGDPDVSRNEQRRISNKLRTSHGRFTVRNALEETAMIVADIEPARLTEILADSNVAHVEADRLWSQAETIENVDVSDRWAAYHGKTQETPYGITQVTAPQVWALGYLGAGIKVGIMDSGGDLTHPDLGYAGGFGAAWGADTLNYSDDIAPCNGHGTHIAGTIAARSNDFGVVGVAPMAQIYALKVFENIGGSCLAYTSSQIRALNWAVTKGIRVINISIGGGFSYAMEDAILQARNQGTFVVSAAGNNGGAVLYPGSSMYGFGIAAVDGSNTRASWSSFGPEVDLSAPGVGINSTMPGGGYGGKSGTSMATPHVVGIIALLLSQTPSLTFDQVRQKLINGALDLETAGFDNNTGYGLARAYNSIVVAPPAVPTIVVSPAGSNTSVALGAPAPNGSAAISFTGTGGVAAAWSATNNTGGGFIIPPIWATLTNASGTGNGTLTWTRNSTGLGYGTWINTFLIQAPSATGSPKVFTDTLTIIQPCTLGINGTTTRTYQVATLGATVTDTIQVTGTCAWTATSSRTPLQISPGRVIFTATSPDTIRITATGTTPVPPPPARTAVRIVTSPQTATVALGDSLRVSATVTWSDSTTTTSSWSPFGWSVSCGVMRSTGWAVFWTSCPQTTALVTAYLGGPGCAPCGQTTVTLIPRPASQEQ